MADQPRSMQNIDLVGGNVALDFANTGTRDGAADASRERIRTYGDLVTFGRRTLLLGESRATGLLAEAARRPAAAARVADRARTLRDTLYSVFSAVAGGVRPGAADVAVLNSFLEEGLRHRHVEQEDGVWRWTWSEGEEPLSQMLWPIAGDAAELLVDGELARVKLCDNEACAWLFLDMSRNRSRRWCDMKDCGNVAKARRHYARRRRSNAEG